MSVFSEIGVGGRNATSSNLFNSIVLAEVTNVKDPEHLNRVKCKLVARIDDEDESNWAIVAGFMSGSGAGATFFPSVGDMVLLAYIGGDMHMPVVLGGVWMGDQKRPYNYDDEGKNPVRSIKTSSGAEILIDDTKDKEKISITTKKGAVLLLDDGEEKLSLKDKEGKNGLDINLKSGEVVIKADKKITLKAGQTLSVLLDGGANKIEAKSDVGIAMKSAKIEAAASAEMALKGAMAKLNADGVVEIKGSIVKIN